ncbi:MAG: J domain-containing protein, partial [Planctomycetota bacterium]
PPGTPSGTKLRLRGKGVPDPRTGKRGDQLCQIKIVPPKKLTPRARELLEQLAAELHENPRRGLW